MKIKQMQSSGFAITEMMIIVAMLGVIVAVLIVNLNEAKRRSESRLVPTLVRIGNSGYIRLSLGNARVVSPTAMSGALHVLREFENTNTGIASVQLVAANGFIQGFFIRYQTTNLPPMKLEK